MITVGGFVTSVCEWVGSHRLFLTAKDQDSWNTCSLVPQIGAVSGPCLFSTWVRYLLIRHVCIIVLFPHSRVAFPSQQAQNRVGHSPVGTGLMHESYGGCKGHAFHRCCLLNHVPQSWSRLFFTTNWDSFALWITKAIHTLFLVLVVKFEC